MYHLDPRTLAYYKASLPLTATRIDTTVSAAVEAMNWFDDCLSGPSNNRPPVLQGEKVLAYPETEALRFYFLNHCFAMLCSKYSDHDVLPESALNLAKCYVDTVSVAGRRLFGYVLKIITREARHLKTASKLAPELKANFGEDFVKFRNSIPGTSTSAVEHLRKSPPQISLDVYCSGIAHLFNNGSFSGGFGGKPWGEIAATIQRLVSGTTSLEAFMDTAYTLAHNNGPIFNKGMNYHGYSGQLIKILDVQSSGQIPHLIADVLRGAYSMSHVDTLVLNEAICLAHQEFPELASCYVDWWLVERLGYQKASYEDMKAKQISLWGEPDHIVEAAALAKAEEAKKLYIMPGVSALKLERAA